MPDKLLLMQLLFYVYIYIYIYIKLQNTNLTPWLMEPGGSMRNSKGLSNNSYPEFLILEPISLKSILILSSHLRLELPKGLFSAGVPVNILKAVLPSSILGT